MVVFLVPLAHFLLTHGGITAVAHAGVAHMSAAQIAKHYGKTVLTNQVKRKAREYANEHMKNKLSDREYSTVLSVIETSETIGQVIDTLSRLGICKS